MKGSKKSPHKNSMNLPNTIKSIITPRPIERMQENKDEKSMTDELPHRCINSENKDEKPIAGGDPQVSTVNQPSKKIKKEKVKQNKKKSSKSQQQGSNKFELLKDGDI